MIHNEIRKYDMPYNLMVYASDLSQDIAVAYFYEDDAPDNEKKLTPVFVLENSPAFIVSCYTDDGVGIGSYMLLDTSRIHIYKGIYIHA